MEDSEQGQEEGRLEGASREDTGCGSELLGLSLLQCEGYLHACLSIVLCDFHFHHKPKLELCQFIQ